MAKKQPVPFGKYFLLDRINIGGMAEVWKGKTYGVEGFEKIVAIKRILPNIAEDEEFITMFIDEAKISVQLTHANVAQIFDLGKILESFFIAMEYISGKDLRAIFDRMRKRGEIIPIPMTCYIMSRVCEGLDYAHRKRDAAGRELSIVHRDVSPQNVLISYEGEVKVIDFGIAKAANKATKTQAGILKGKFGYMSPEQVRGLPLDRRSDCFAIGVVLYEMLTGERLFVGESDFSTLEKVRNVDILPPTTYNRRIPEPLERIVLKALAKDVEDRYQWANELQDDLQRFLITSDAIFSRKDLAQYMKSTFAEDVEREKIKMAEAAEIKLPAHMAPGADMGPPPAPPPQTSPRPAPPQQSGARPGPAPPGRPATTPRPVNPATTPRPVVAPRVGPPPGRPSPAAARPVSEPRVAAPPPVPKPSLDTGRTEIFTPGMFGGGEAPGAGAGSGSLPPPVPAGEENPTNPNEQLAGFDTVVHGRNGHSPVPGRPGLGDGEDDSTISSGDFHPTAGSAQGGPPVLARSSGVRSGIRTAPAQRVEISDAPPKSSGSGLKMVLVAVGFGLVGLLAGLAVLVGIRYGNLLGGGEGGHLMVVSADEVAEIRVDGKLVGDKVPLVHALDAGEHEVVVSGKNGKSFKKTILVKAGEQAMVEAALGGSKEPAYLVIVPTPLEAEVIIDGRTVKEAGRGSAPNLDVQAGEHELVVRAPGYEESRQKITVAAGERVPPIMVPLKAVDFVLELDSDPQGATVLIDGEAKGVTPVNVNGVDPGRTHQLVLKKKCYADYESALPVQSGAKASYKPTLTKQAGCP